MKYYFDYQDHYRVTDKRGQNCQTLQDAREFADELSKQLARTNKVTAEKAEFVIVIDEAGEEVYRARLPDGYGICAAAE